MAAILVVTSAGSTIPDVSDIEVVVVQADEWTSSRDREDAAIGMVVAIAAVEGDKSEVLEPAERPWLRPASEAINLLPAWWLRPLRLPSSYG